MVWPKNDVTASGQKQGESTATSSSTSGLLSAHDRAGARPLLAWDFVSLEDRAVASDITHQQDLND
jgi:hypothetical protein